MRYLFLAAITVLFDQESAMARMGRVFQSLSAASSQASTPREARAPIRVKSDAQVLNPCTRDFTLNVSVVGANGVDAEEPIGFSLMYRHAAKRGIASRQHAGQSNAFDKNQCERWGKTNWELLERMVFESGRAERKTLECVNVARIEYSLGGKAKAALLCLGSSSHDTLAHAFKAFYESGDGMVAR